MNYTVVIEHEGQKRIPASLFRNRAQRRSK
jgi:hypothetical protein